MEASRASLDLCFGDKPTTLLDEFERLSLEVQLNRAIALERCNSAPAVHCRRRSGFAAPRPRSQQTGGRRWALFAAARRLWRPVFRAWWSRDEERSCSARVG
ncbi:hypothetical protein ZIOFF_064181 [Zingiber officinale]|uniref:Uncharacterized protein n=1 Tax=Zingiber officinale TaxID=94328 RepID=A0A8J5EVQ5_ZINOF|nr:hypothetical protein ZIOFF_064181 [Zingiber officinale]